MRVDNQNVELCLCGRCASAFYQSAAYRICRTDPLQVIQEECSYCSFRRRYDYKVQRRTKPVLVKI